ncbi:competence protein ComK [Evansella sp. AB-P1]|uniref:competence protein ComK n=1 Tax=Evansella sp. AB-P1 TaxID=3037653 RepID=UPI00241DDFCB|nr:competence protein ComK [Evansella sp. AB-P1]MDG5789316.1 competence protein ComK [Evansella sp. AB-P1]
MNEQVMNVENDYVINKRTMALLPALNMLCETIVMEGERVIYVRKTPMQLIKRACMKGGASYNGRRDAAVHEMNIHRKVPIAINTHESMYTFPTHSPKNFQCNWIFYQHILCVTPVPKNPNMCNITFKNCKQITIHASKTVIEKQMHRTAFSILLFSQRWEDDYGTANEID